MKICPRCGMEFDLRSVKCKIDRMYGVGTYDDYFSEVEVCTDCAITEIGADYEIGGEVIEDMGSGWSNE